MFTVQSTWSGRWSSTISMCCTHAFSQVRIYTKCLQLEVWQLISISWCVLCLTGQNATCRRRYGDHQDREKSMCRRDADKHVEARTKQVQKKSSTANSDVILPKIVKGWQIRQVIVYLFESHKQLFSEYIMDLFVSIPVNCWIPQMSLIKKCVTCEIYIC